MRALKPRWCMFQTFTLQGMPTIGFISTIYNCYYRLVLHAWFMDHQLENIFFCSSWLAQPLTILNMNPCCTFYVSAAVEGMLSVAGLTVPALWSSKSAANSTDVCKLVSTMCNSESNDGCNYCIVSHRAARDWLLLLYVLMTVAWKGRGGTHHIYLWRWASNPTINTEK